MLSSVSAEECEDALSRVGVSSGDKLIQYMQLLLEWNEKLNLTGAKTPQELALKHIADVSGALHTVGGSSMHFADVGSGGGIPGIVLSIMVPNARVVLIERRQKKASALSAIVSSLGLEDRVKVIARSFEEVRSFSKETEYWFRGFLPGPKLAAYLSVFFPRAELHRLVLMKGPAWPSEKLEIMSTPRVSQAWLERFGSSVEMPYSLPQGAGERIVVLV